MNPQADQHTLQELDLLLAEAASVIEDSGHWYDRQAAPAGSPIVLFGAGNIGRKALAFLRGIGAQPVAFSDNRPDLAGQAIDGLSVLSPAEAVQQYGETATFVITIFNRAVRAVDVVAQLRRLGAKYVVPFAFFAWKYPQEFLPYYFLELPARCFAQRERIRAAFQLLADAESRREYLAQVRWRLLGELDVRAQNNSAEQYFSADVPVMLKGKVFVDVGAYDGDTLVGYFQRVGEDFHSAYVFEPDPGNYQALVNYIHGLPEGVQSKIYPYQAAVGAENSTVKFNASSLTSAAVLETDGVDTTCYALDAILPRFAAMYIKIDIEGFEEQALLGAKQTILSTQPDLAVCVYHRPDDLWNIPLLLHEDCDQYRFFLRRYMEDCWESVCYAVR